MNKAKMNYWTDIGIGVAGLISAISGLVFLLPGDPTTGILGISYQTWNTVHTWSSLGAITGVVAHTALHWKWMVSMTRQMLSPKQEQAVSTGIAEPVASSTAPSAFSRRAFLLYGGTATVAVAATLAGLKAIFGVETAEANQSENQIAAVQQPEEGVACPFGLVNDPYPGRCKHYKDSNGDGICDYSVTGSGSITAVGDDESIVEGFSRHRSGFGRP